MICAAIVFLFYLKIISIYYTLIFLLNDLSNI